MSIKLRSDKLDAVAEKLAKKGKFQEAIAEYQKILTGEGEQDVNIRNTIGDLYLKLDQQENAIEEFKKIASFYKQKGLYSKLLAIFKKINRLIPNDVESALNLADLYFEQGFLPEAKKEYIHLAKELKRKNRINDAIKVYERLLRSDNENMELRLTLADLYVKQGMIDNAIEKFNEVAEFKIQNNDLKGAEKIILHTKSLKEEHSRTLSNLIDLLNKRNKRKEAVSVVEEMLNKDKDNIKALRFLGNLYYEDKEFKEASKIFSRIISLKPSEVEVKIKLGKIYVQNNLLDQAFKLFEPVIDSLVRKQKEEKGIGLLGLILTSQKKHIPTLEKLASIYKLQNQKKSLETVYKVILSEYRESELDEKANSILSELVKLAPENEEFGRELQQVTPEVEPEEEVSETATVSPVVDENEETIKTNLAKVDLYAEQGLIRNAKRILENLRVRFTDSPLIFQKIEELKAISEKINDDEIPNRLKKIYVSRAQDETAEPHLEDTFKEEKMTAADIFSDTDIVPVYQEAGEKKYFDVANRIVEELDAIADIFNYQLKGDTTVVEKPLPEIVSEFREALKGKVASEDYDSHYNLGVAFLKQGLRDEAIEEFKLASEDEKLSGLCFNIIGACHRQKKNYPEALKWIEKALKLSPSKSNNSFALKFELALVYEDMKEIKKALKLYSEIKDWNEKFRDVTERIESIKTKS
ncbi:tetratricopeptide repeat protein [Acidobacteriota bacterium]